MSFVLEINETKPWSPFLNEAWHANATKFPGTPSYILWRPTLNGALSTKCINTWSVRTLKLTNPCITLELFTIVSLWTSRSVCFSSCAQLKDQPFFFVTVFKSALVKGVTSVSKLSPVKTLTTELVSLSTSKSKRIGFRFFTLKVTHLFSRERLKSSILDRFQRFVEQG